MVLVRFEIGIVGGDLDRREVRVDGYFAGGRIKRDDGGLAGGFPGGRRGGWGILGHDGLSAQYEVEEQKILGVRAS